MEHLYKIDMNGFFPLKLFGMLVLVKHLFCRAKFISLIWLVESIGNVTYFIINITFQSKVKTWIVKSVFVFIYRMKKLGMLKLGSGGSAA